MAASIAKLAIILIADTTKLRTGLQQAQASVKGFKHRLDQSAGGMDAIGAGAMKMAGPIAAAAIAVGVLKKAAVGWFAEGERMQRQLAELRDGAETFASEWQRTRDRIGLGAVPAADFAQNMLVAFRLSMDELQKMAGIQPTGAFQREMEAAAAASKKLDEQLKVSNKRLAEQVAEMNKFKERGKSLEESLRTPAEKLKADFADLNDLFKRGAIEQETLRRGLKRSTDEFRNQALAASEAKFKPVGALEFGSQAEHSARVNAAATQNARTDANTKLLAALLAAQQQNTKVLANKPVSQFRLVNIP